MTFHFCTISTTSHLFKVFALFDSLKKQQEDVVMHVLITDADSVEPFQQHQQIGLKYYLRSNIKNPLSEKISKKYIGNADRLRWSFKSLFINYLFQEQALERVIYLDNDIAFFGDFAFLFNYFNDYHLILTPHHYSINPEKKQNWLEANFRVGLYNAGFLGVHKNAADIMLWWAKCCLYRCEKNSMRGLFDDQKYLDLFPIIEPKTLILSHKGCNVAEWNKDVCKRVKSGLNVLIDGKYDIIFIHFNNTTIQSFLDREDPLLYPYFERYLIYLKQHKPNLNIKGEGYRQRIADSIKLAIWKMMNLLNNRTL